MRLFILILFCAFVATTLAEPEPKKYKLDAKKSKPANTTLTDEERKFLRDVEAKFNIKNEAKDKKKEETDTKVIKTEGKLPFPAVIAIEIVNDTDSKGKGKRTIDANLGYGYKTNSGYSYSYFGKPTEDRGKFMIYPYSQEDIPPSKGHTSITNVEITPSKAFELVPVKDEKEGYDYPKPSTEFKTNYDDVKGLVSPPPSYKDISHSHGQAHTYVPSTLYTTYNGHELSGLSGNFPTVMQNYFVDPSQLLKNPEYQNVGLTNEHLRVHGSQIEDQRVVPVLVLRIPSSSLRNPTAELFANLPSNYPLSRYLNNVNLQDLVNQYFKKIGYSVAPQVMSYRDSLIPQSGGSPNVNTQYNKHYASPHIQPAYTQSAHSGVQYSAVQPVMAHYPTSYTRHSISHGHSLYQMPHQQKYDYRYKYVPQTSLPQTYYVQSQYQQPSYESAQPEAHSHTSSEVQYETQPQINHQEESHASLADAYHRSPHTHAEQSAKEAYEYIKQGNIESASPSYETVSESGQDYYSQNEHASKETVSIIPSQYSQQEQHSHSDAGNAQNYYQQQSSEESDNGLILSENYPSKDHTIATVLPVSYNTHQQNTGAVQTVSYVTPMPYSSKYKSPYNIMVPQTFLTNPSTEKVMYVDSHSVPGYSQTYHQNYNPEAEYTIGPHHVPPVGKQKPPSYPRNYHSHPKRMVKPERHGNTQMYPRKTERHDKKKSS